VLAELVPVPAAHRTSSALPLNEARLNDATIEQIGLLSTSGRVSCHVQPALDNIGARDSVTKHGSSIERFGEARPPHEDADPVPLGAAHQAEFFEVGGVIVFNVQVKRSASHVWVAE
jgi:hypothetical protein